MTTYGAFRRFRRTVDVAMEHFWRAVGLRVFLAKLRGKAD
jgi:hypothetical protein